MEPIKEIVKNVEQDLVIGLTISVRHKKITFEESKLIAKEYLSYFPFRDHEDLFERLYFLSTKYREIRKIYVEYSPKYYEEKTQKVLGKMRKSLNLKDFDEAVSIARRANYAKI